MNKAFFGIGKIYPLLLCLLTIAITVSNSLLAQPAGFTDDLVIDGWSQAVGVTFDKNGSMYVWEKRGKVWTVENGVKAADPLIDISEEVGNWRDFGLVGFALDPNFLNNGYIYLWYVVDRHHLLNFGTNRYNPNASSEKEATIARLTRYTVNFSGNTKNADYNSRKILIGESKSSGPPILHESHGAGQIIFGTDGTLMVTVGDGASYTNPIDEGSNPATYYQQALVDGIITSAQNIGAYRCQSLNNLSGKILRIDPETGNGVPSNPYYQAINPRSSQSRIWSIGIRNPYRIALKPETGSHNANKGDPGTFFFGDVGWSTWEDLNVVEKAGQNFGWPIYEGISQRTGFNNPNYAVSDSEHARPKVDWRHGADQARAFVNGNIVNIGTNGVSGRQFRGNSSTGGVWYTDDDFPEAYQNTYFHADYSSGWIRNFGFDEQHNLTFVKDFKLNAGAVVFLTTSPVENGLFYVRYPNQIRRISFIGNSNKKPVAIVETDKNYGASPLTVNFDASQSFDPEFSPLTFNWDFGDNATSTEPNPSVIFEALSNNPTTYTVKLQVRDAQGATSEKIIPISLNNTPPVIVSTSIDQQHSFSARNGATLNLNAIVTDQEHNGQLKYEWQTALFHNGHSHAEPVDNNPATQTSLSPIECDGSTYWFRVTLKVTDPAGLSATYQKDIFPDCAGLPQTINCAPIPDQSITVGDIVLNVTATSGLPVSTYLLEGPATIFGNKIVPSGFPGRVTIRATQGGNETYQPAEPIERSFNIVLPSNASCTAEGLITRDIWNGAGRNTLNDIPVNTTPNQSGTLSNFEVRPFTSADNAQRVRGFICPPVTGIYTFWVASDEDSQLWLSTNADPNNKRLVANLNGSTRANQWNKYASQQSEGIFLVAGNQYYIEGLMNGGGHLSAGWKMPDNSLDRPISGQYLSTFKSKQEQVITFFGIPDKMTTDPAFTIGATANSGLPVDFAIISGPATVAGTTVTLTGEEGVVTIRATQNGNDVYNPAKSVDRRFEVVAPPTVPSVTITSPANGSSFMENQVDIRYTLEGNLAFHDADHLLINLDNQAPIDVHSLNGIYTLYNLSEGLHTVKIQLADSNHRPLANNEATAVTSFNIVPSEKPQTINFFPIANKSTTDIPFAISASATSGLPVLLTIESGPASMNGNLVTLGGAAGTVVVKASQNGNEAYLPAPVVRQSFQVIAPATEKANQTVNFSTIANKYTTDAPFAVAATASSGLPVTLTIESGPASINGNIVTLNGVAGTVVIRASQAGNEQYKRAISFGRSFQVIEKIKQNQLISFASLPDKLTTDQPFSVNATASSGLPVSLSILNGPATISNGVISLTGTAGTVTISASQAGNDSYLAAPNVDRPFTVTAPVVTPPNEPAAVYCELKSDFPWQEWIEQVTFGNIDQRSSKNIYELFDFSTSSFSKESTYSLTVVPKFSWTQSDQYITAWIDYNQDNDFDDAGEEVLRTISKGGFPLQPVDQAIAEVLIPSSAKTGKTRLRIAMQRGSYANSCGKISAGEVEDYLIMIKNSDGTQPPVSKQNQQISFPTIPDQLTTAIPFALNAVASSNLPVRYDIVAGPAIINGNQITLNGAAGTVVVQASQVGNSQYHAAQNVNRAFKVSVPQPPVDTGNPPPANINYCAAKGNSPWQEWIGKIAIGTINHNSAKDGHGDFTNISTNLTKGLAYSISVTPSFSWTQWNEYVNVWIDFNQNGSFDDVGEQVLSGISYAGAAQSIPQAVSGTVIIPTNARTGKTRMRVAMQQGQYANSCGTFEFGEVEDYSVNIIANFSNRSVPILDFAAYTHLQQTVALEWISNGDQLASYYQIERSKDNFQFYPIAQQLPETFLDEPTFYTASDESPLKGTSYYRVKRINQNGSFKYSNAVKIERAYGVENIYIFPNPVRNIINLHIKSLIGKAASIKIYNSYGQLVKESKVENVQTPTLSFSMEDVQNGMYYLQIKSKGKRAIGRKFLLSRNY